VTATISLGGGTLGGGMQVNAAGGRASFSDLAITGTIGARTLSFASGTLVAATSSNINLTPGAADHLTIVTQPSSTAGSGAAFGQQPVVQVRDISENVVTSPVVAVVAAIASGGPALGGTASQNTVNGVATFTNLAISGALGTRTLSFTSGVLPPVTSSNIDVLFGAATQLTITTPPSATAASGEVLAPQPAIQLRDATGNAVPQSGVTITAAIFSGGGSLGSTTTAMTDANGLATFSGLAITGLVGTRTLRFTSGALTPATSGSIAITAGAASQLTITTQPSTTAANGAILGQQPAVQITDGGGNPVSQLGVPVTVAIATGGGTLGGIATVNTNANGLAPFAGLSITGLIGARTLSFTSAPLAAATSNSISITPGAANHLTITTQPGGTTAASGAALAPQPVVEVRDVSENVVTTPAVTVTAAIATGGGTLTGTANPTTVNGVATFTNLVITGLVGARTLSFTSGVLPVVNSASFNLVAGAATQLTITTQPSTTDSNAKVFPIQPVIQLRDGGGNAVSQVVGVTAAITAPGTGTLRGTATVNTSAAGVATFAGLSILAPTVGNRTLTFTSGTLTSVTSGNINITVGTARIMTAVAGTTPQTAPVSTAVGVDPAVLVTDSGGIPVSGRNVIFTVATGGGTLSPASPATIATNASGIATVTSWTLGAVAGTNTLSAASATPAPALTALTFTATGTAVITGTMWVANFGVPSIGIFPAAAVGNVAPTSTLTSTALGGPAFLARDAAGLLYVSDFTNGQVLVFAAGATGAATPVRSITGLLNPAGIALNAAGNLYVADQANATVYVFAANATGALGVGAVPVRTITGAATLMQNPSGIALDGDTLHVADLGGFVSTFGPTATGNVAPLRTIATTDLGTPWGLVEDATGGLWVANQNGGALATGSVVRFARGSDSNTQTVTPTNVLDGVLTTLNGPVGLARSGNNIYVTNFTAGAEAVLVFPTTATGNVAPASTLSGANTGLTQAFGITF
jgi:sugar lactone lactonase YvrE